MTGKSMAQNPTQSESAASTATDPLSGFFASTAEVEAFEFAYGETTAGQHVRSSPDALELLGFWVADEEYAVDIITIEEIIKIPEITYVPRCHPSVLGIISLRGTIVPVVDMRIILGLSKTPIAKESRILVLRGDGDPVGLLVDRVTSVVRLRRNAIESAPANVGKDSSDVLKGVGRVDERLIIILDVEAVLNVMEHGA